mgnify:CR=1 FL=1
MTNQFLTIGPEDAECTILLAHGAGAAMDSGAMTAMAEALSAEVLRVVRFEFGYMAARRSGGSRRPPPRAERLKEEYLAAARNLRCDGPLIIGGKSMGGRVASMVVDDLLPEGVSGLLCLGYPFHPPGKPERLRTAHLKEVRAPTLICQGTRDPFGSLIEVSDYDLSPAIEVFWLKDGDHDLRPRKSVSGHSTADHMMTMARKVAAWSKAIA